MSEKFIVETSARHLHLTQQDFEVLFGAGAQPHAKKSLSQPKGSLKMSLLGPFRSQSQVEVSYTDARGLGLTPPCRESGDLKGSCPCKLVGPAGELELSEGVIVAKRHIHLDPATAEKMGVQDKQIVSVRVDTPERPLVFGGVVIRVSSGYAPAMHIDTDEANAGCCFGEVWGTIAE